MEHEQEIEIRELLVSSAREIGVVINEQHVEQFMRYYAHLIEWNRTINLTSIIDPKEIVLKHFVDSLASLVAIGFSEQAMVLDVGSGGGFPGLPLKIVRPDMRLVLVEPVRKKCSFLNSVIGLLQLNETYTFIGTVEQYAKQSVRSVVDMIVIRALKLEEIEKYASILLKPRGRVVLYRSEPIKNGEIGKQFHVVSETALTLPQGSGKRVISVLETSNS